VASDGLVVRLLVGMAALGFIALCGLWVLLAHWVNESQVTCDCGRTYDEGIRTIHCPCGLTLFPHP
jgi:hypothetical protein